MRKSVSLGNHEVDIRDFALIPPELLLRVEGESFVLEGPDASLDTFMSEMGWTGFAKSCSVVRYMTIGEHYKALSQQIEAQSVGPSAFAR